jgi:hypothetical protein
MNMIEKKSVRPALLKMLDKWPSSVVAREEIGRFTGGMIRPGTLANLDSIGKGPEGRFFTGGRKVVYDAEQFVLWLDKRSSDQRV